MTIHGSAGAECGASLGQTEPEFVSSASNYGTGTNVTITAGALRANGLGAGYYTCDASSSFNDAHCAMANVTPEADATKIQIQMVCTITDTSTAFDQILFASNCVTGVPVVGTNGIIIKRLRTGDGKIHVYDSAGNEIDSANAFTPPADPTAFGLVLEIDLAAAPSYGIRLYYDATANGSYVLKQTGTASGAPTTPFNMYWCEMLPKGTTHNWKLKLDDVVVQDDGGSFNRDAPAPTSAFWRYWDVVREGVPNADTGTYNETWTTDGGVACGVGSGCAAKVAEEPPSITNYIKLVGIQSLQRQSFPTSSKVLVTYPTALVGYVRAVATFKNISGSGLVTQTMLIQSGGTNVQAGATPSTLPIAGEWIQGGAGQDHDLLNVAWTTAAAQATEIGVRMSDSLNATLECGEMYKIVTLRLNKSLPINRRSMQPLLAR